MNNAHCQRERFVYWMSSAAGTYKTKANYNMSPNMFFKKKVTMAQADTPPKSGSAQVRFAMVGVGCIGLEHIRNILLLPDAARSVKYSATMVLSGAALRCCAHVL